MIILKGSVAEWFKAPVLKTGIRKRIVSSNLTASAIQRSSLSYTAIRDKGN